MVARVTRQVRSRRTTSGNFTSQRFVIGQNANSRLFRINGLEGNCSHVVDRYIGYTYPSLPVGVRPRYFRRMFAYRRNRRGRSTSTALSHERSPVVGLQVFSDPTSSAAWARRCKGHESLALHEV